MRLTNLTVKISQPKDIIASENLCSFPLAALAILSMTSDVDWLFYR